MILYHGTDKVDLEYLDSIESRKDIDFGFGLYVTSNKEQAEDWAKKKGEWAGTGIGAVYESEIDIDNIPLKVLEYAEGDEDYNCLCYLCRYEAEEVASDTITNFENVDIIYGPMIGNAKEFKSNIKCFHGEDIPFLSIKDKVKSINYNVKSNISTFEDLVSRINLYGDEKNDQYCFKSEKAKEILNEGIKKVTYIKKINNEFITSKQLLKYDKKLKKIKYIE